MTILDDAMRDPNFLARLAGARHRHHSKCIHNLPADDQIALRGKTREWWEAVGLPEPTVITPDDWEVTP